MRVDEFWFTRPRVTQCSITSVEFSVCAWRAEATHTPNIQQR